MEQNIVVATKQHSRWKHPVKIKKAQQRLWKCSKSDIMCAILPLMYLGFKYNNFLGKESQLLFQTTHQICAVEMVVKGTTKVWSSWKHEPNLGFCWDHKWTNVRMEVAFWPDSPAGDDHTHMEPGQQLFR